jgi:hypothetical protein
MIKSIFVLIVAILFAIPSFSQNQKYTRKYSGTVKYQKTEQPATVFEFPYPASQVEDGLMEFFREQGSKPKESKGFYYVSNVRMPKEDKVNDIYYKVEKDGKEASKVYAIVTEPGENPVNRTSSHNALVAAGAGAGVVAAVGPAMEDHDYKVQLEKQEEEIRKSEKKMNDLLEESKKLEKKSADINKEIEVNRQEQEKLQAELDNKKQLYQQFVEKKKKK